MDLFAERIFTYDALNRLTGVTRSVGGVVEHVETYTYNAVGAVKTTFDPVAMTEVTLDDQRPLLAGGSTGDAAVPNTLNGQPVTLDGGGRVTALNDRRAPEAQAEARAQRPPHQTLPLRPLQPEPGEPGATTVMPDRTRCASIANSLGRSLASTWATSPATRMHSSIRTWRIRSIMTPTQRYHRRPTVTHCTKSVIIS
ncbi:MAG: hypothetical protein ABSE49_21430 [Polyangiaceae bacterium]|jgi:hypothetical protein